MWENNILGINSEIIIELEECVSKVLRLWPKKTRKAGESWESGGEKQKYKTNGGKSSKNEMVETNAIILVISIIWLD